MDHPKIIINDQTLEQMTNQVLRPIDDALEKAIHKELNPCIQAATNFLNSIRQGYENLATANIIAKRQEKIKRAMEKPENNTIELAQEYSNNKKIFQDLYARSQVVDINIKMQKFSKELNNFLNQKIQIAYVDTNRKGKNPQVFLVDDIGQIMHKGMGSKGAGIKTRINMSRKKALDAMNSANGAIRRLAEEDYMTLQQIKNLKGSYNQVIFRYNKYKYQVKKKANKVVHVILWKPEIDWKIVVMGNNQGDIKEAYVGALINRTGFISAEMEKNIDDFMQYVSQVDAVPGMLQGDVSEMLENGGTIEYAVKGAKASFMSLQLAIKLAIEILTSQPIFDKESLRRKKMEYAKDIKPRNQQITMETLYELFDNNIPDTLNNFIKS